jgi:dihydroorotase
MPNTRPPLDDAAVVSSVLATAEAVGLCEVASSGCITKGRSASSSRRWASCYALGVRIFTDDGAVCDERERDAPRARVRALDPGLGDRAARGRRQPRRRWLHARRSGGPHGWHPRGGRRRETVIVARDIELLRPDGYASALPPRSAAETVDLVRAAKAAGCRSRARPRPHHFTLTDARCASFDPMFKVHPPLRTSATSPPSGLGSPTAPSTPSPPTTRPTPPRARSACSRSAPGCSASRPPLALTLTELVEPGHLNLRTALGALSWRPAEIAGLRDQGGALEAGRVANIAVIDPRVKWEVDPLRLASRARNTPYIGRKLTGKVRHTIFRGEPVVIDAEATR